MSIEIHQQTHNLCESSLFKAALRSIFLQEIGEHGGIRECFHVDMTSNVLAVILQVTFSKADGFTLCNIYIYIMCVRYFSFIEEYWFFLKLHSSGMVIANVTALQMTTIYSRKHIYITVFFSFFFFHVHIYVVIFAHANPLLGSSLYKVNHSKWTIHFDPSSPVNDNSLLCILDEAHS